MTPNKAWTRNEGMINTAKPMSPALRHSQRLVLIGASLVLTAIAFAQTNLIPQGGEFPITAPLDGEQMRPAMALGDTGGLVVWHDNITDPSGLGVSAQRLDASGYPVGGPFRINQSMGLDQQNPRVSVLNNGGFVTAWESGKAGADNVFVRFLTSDGNFSTDELLVNQTAFQGTRKVTTNVTLIRNNKVRTRDQNFRETVKGRQEFNSFPQVAELTDGNVLVAYSSSRKESLKTIGFNESIRWNDRRSIFITNRTRIPLNLQFDYMQDVYAQRLSASGQKLGEEFPLNTNREYNQRNVAVAPRANGGFVACWVSEVPGGAARVNTSNQTVRAGARVDIYARLFQNDGTAAAVEFRVNASTSPCGSPVVVGRSDSGFTVAWTERNLVQANGLEIWFRSFDQFGVALGLPILANAYQFGDQFAPSIAAVGGKQLLVWNSMGQDGSWEGVFGRLLDSNATAGDEFRINTRAYLRQVQPAVAGRGANALVIWSSYTFGSGHDLFGQKLQTP
jgi:hypothetical protein